MVFFRPTDFVDSEDPAFIGRINKPKKTALEMSLEELVAEHLKTEKQRDDTDKVYSERAVPITFRSLPAGLAHSLSEAKNTFHDVSLPELTRCMSYQIEPWLKSLTKGQELVDLHDNICHKADGFPDLITKLDKTWAFSFVNPRSVETQSRVSSWGTIGWVKTSINELAKRYGVDSYKLFAVSLCGVLSTNTSGITPKNISDYLIPEVINLKMSLVKRMLLLKSFDQMLDLDIEAKSGKK
jgi:hypothetical protein